MDGSLLPFHQREDGQRYFTNADMAAMVDAGLIAAEDRWELIEGAWFDMPTEGFEHMMLRTKLLREFVLALGRNATWIVGSEGSLFLSADVELRPDIIVHRSDVSSNSMTGSDILMVVEVMKSSQKRDLELKRPIYAKAGVPELWLVDLDREVTILCNEPDCSGAYGSVHEVRFGEVIRPSSLDLSIRFSELV